MYTIYVSNIKRVLQLRVNFKSENFARYVNAKKK